MDKIRMLVPILLLAICIPLARTPALHAQAGNESLSKVIDYLVGKVADSHLTFVRNGEKHSSEAAAQHIRLKYKYFKSEIQSPQDFIRLCASKSLLSGKAYMVITPSGEVPVENWLEQKLAVYRKEH